MKKSHPATSIRLWLSPDNASLGAKLVRYAIGGIFIFIIKTGLTFFLTEILQFWYFGSYLITLLTIIIAAFIYNKYITFGATDNKSKSFVKFMIAQVISAVFDASIVRLCTELLNVYYLLSISVSTMMLSVFKYALYDLFVFKKVATHSPGGNVYDKHHSGNPIVKNLMDRFHSEVFNAIRQCAPQTLFDAGCGEGYTTSLVQAQFPATVIHALEFDSETLVKTRKTCSGFAFCQGSIYSIPAHDSSHDLVFATEVLEHLEAPEKAIKECIRVSKRWCLFTVPNEPIWRIMNMARLAYLAQFGNTPGHIQHWNRNSFKKVLHQHFTNVHVFNVFIWNIAVCEKVQEKST